MRILAVEFSSPRRSVALLDRASGGRPEPLAEASETAGHPTHGAAMVREVLERSGLQPAQVSKLAVGLGPGSYTGIRHALAFAQGWQLAHGTPVVGIGSAPIMAAQLAGAGRRGPVAIVIDAQREEFYLGLFILEEHGARCQEPMRLVDALALRTLRDRGVFLAGPPSEGCLEEVAELMPTAVQLALLAVNEAGTTRAETLEPIYLRSAAFVKAPPPRHWNM